MKDEIWITKEGRKIFVEDLPEDYAKNIIRMILRKQRIAKEKLEIDILQIYPEYSIND